MSRPARQRRRRRSKGGAGRIVLITLGVLASMLVIGVIGAVGYVVSIANSGPSLAELKPKAQGENSVVYAADGKTRLGVIQSDVLRQPISSKIMPVYLRQATVAIEDRRFFEHGGVDFEGVIRAALKNIKSHNTVQGGSTLTMQLIKNLYTGNTTRTGWAGYKRKIREAKLAQELEDLHPGRTGKEWILSKYVNSVPYGTVGGQTAYGVQAAARVFFNKGARELTLPQAALLAGLPQAPTSYNPYLHPERARERRHEVLQQMAKAHYISADQAAQADAAPLGLQHSHYYGDRRESYFFDYVRKELVRKYGLKKVRQGGLRVYTTIDLAWQDKARAAIAKNLDQPNSPSAAIVSIDPRNGHIRAMASSSNYGDSKFNLATQAKRQPGSTFKPIVLMDALRRGVDINRTTYVSKYLHFTDPKWGKIDVHTAEGHESNRPKSLFEAIVSSDNTVFQQLDLDLGPASVTRTAHDMGITSFIDTLPAAALGGLTYGVSPLEMARAYVTINDGGVRKKPIAITKVRFPDGKVDRSLAAPQDKKIFTDGQTYEAIQAMKANAQRGTGTRANLPNCPTAGKTGTTSSFTDAWFDGFVRNLNTVVWVGFPGTTTSMTNVSWAGGGGEMFGGDAPAQIWHDFMASVTDPKTCSDWPQPKEPFVAQPFHGKYESSSPPSSYDPNNPYGYDQYGNGQGANGDTTGGDTGTGTGDTGGGNGKGQGNGGTGGNGGKGNGGGTKYPPSQYESPPQGTPTPTPNPAPTSGDAGAAPAPGTP